VSEIICVDHEQFLPALSIAQAVERYNAVVEFVRTVLRPDVDYGLIPGTSKPTLLKPGAEKLTTFFGLCTRFQIIERVEDWTGEQHGGEPFFYYLYRCQLWRGATLIAEADGSCNSFEQKYRYRQADRRCPACGQPTIIKGKQEYGGGWLCFAKKGGCGAKFKDGDQAIEGQQLGRVRNADIFDQVNTLQKMAEKRALIAATLLAVNASEIFTQDVEDLVIEVSTTGRQRAELLAELQDARSQEAAAGGTPPKLSWRELAEMSEIDLAAEIAATRARLAEILLHRQSLAGRQRAAA
jgi:hypothetical protein